MQVFLILNNHPKKNLWGAPQTMRCTICHIIKQVQSSNNTTREHKGLLTYNPTYDITYIKKHIDKKHKAIVAKYVLHYKNEDKASNLGHEKSKKCKRVTPFAIIDFFSNV
jgi:ribosome-binding ATPase YchF (GTP1/OBG family)